MRINGLVPMIFSNDVLGSIQFYTKRLGFTCTAYESSDGWANLVLDYAKIMIASPGEEVEFEQGNFTGSFYIHLNGIEAMWNKVKDHVEVVYPLEHFDYGLSEFAIKDNNGYMLQFGENRADQK